MATLSTLLGVTKGAKGDIGLEIETESRSRYAVPDTMFDYWSTHDDHSLRNNGVEYTFRTPYTYESKQYKAALDSFEALTKLVKFNENSPYTSVHVHLNMLDVELVQMINFITVYFLVEELLAEYCGNNRNGNLFCLKTSNAEANLTTATRMVSAIFEGRGNEYIRTLNATYLKYSGLNFATLRNLGSLEVRTHPGTVDVERIKRWINILWTLKTKSSEFKDPGDIINSLKGADLTKFVSSLFGSYSKFFNYQDIEKKLKAPIWYVAEIATAIPSWKNFGTKLKKEKVNPDRWAHINIGDAVERLVRFEEQRRTVGPAGDVVTNTIRGRRAMYTFDIGTDDTNRINTFTTRFGEIRNEEPPVDAVGDE